ncbi:putative ribonuclease H-like domain-containing protein [Tanacetum coccineum]
MRIRTSSTNSFNTVRTLLNTASASRTSYPAGTSSEPQLMPIDGSFSIDINDYLDDPLMPELEDTAEIHSTGIFGSAYDDSPNTPIDDQSVGAEADFNNMEPSINVSHIPTTRIHSIHPKDQIIGDLKLAVQTRRMAKKSEAGLVSFINKQRRTNHKDFQNCLFACFLSQVELKKTLIDLPKGKKAIGTKWVFRNKKDQRGIMVRNKARLVAQGHRQEEGIDYDEVFAHVARIEAIRLFLAYASYMDFTVYQIDMKSTFLYGTIEEEVYVNQPPGFEDPEFPNKVYKVEKALYGLHQAPRAWYETLSTYLLENGFRRGTINKTLFIKKIKNDILLVQVYVDDIIFGSTKKSLSTEFEKLMHKRFQMSSIGELTFFLGLQVEQRKDGIFLSQDKYVYDILKKFGFTTMKTVSTPMETHKSLSSNASKPDVDVHLYRSMIGTLLYLTSSKPDIMFAVCACSRFQVTLNVSHMHAVKRIFRYLKGKSTLGLWYPKDSPMDLIAYSDNDYTWASIDRKSTTRGCQFLGSRTKIHIDNKSTISVIKNPVSHSKTKHIEIRFHFIRDSYEKKLIEMVKIHRDNNVADLLTKAFNVTRFKFLIASIVDTSKANGLGKDFPNPFMAGSLPKTIKQSNDPPLSKGYTLGSREDSLELMELMANYTQIVCFVRKKNREIWTFQAYFATIEGHEKLITGDSLRRHLKLEDAEGISSLSNEEIFEHLAHMGFIQLLLNKQQRLLLPHTRTYPTPTLTSKLFSNMRIASKGYSGVVTPLFEKETTSMPHDSPLHVVHSHGSAEGSMQQHDLMVLVNKLNDRIDRLEKDLQQTKKTYSTALTKLVLRVKKLEYKLKSGKARRKAKIVLFDDEEIAKDSSKQGRKISQIDEDPTISLVQDEGISLILHEEEVHEKPSDETKVIVQEETPTKIIEEHGSGEKGEMEISTASPPKVAKVSIVEAHVYTRRSAKDKGKAIMEEPATLKKVKKRTQVQLSMDEELARKMEEEERARFNTKQEARALQEEEERLNLEAAWELQRQLDERQQVPTEATQSKGID